MLTLRGGAGGQLPPYELTKHPSAAPADTFICF